MPLKFTKTLSNGGSLAMWQIEEGESELLSGLTISPIEREELQGIRSELGRVRWLAVRNALNSLFPEVVSACEKDPHGKPFIPGYPGYISLSHSNDFAVALAHPTNPVGIDIEIIKPKIKRIAHKFLNNTEIDFVAGEDEIEKLYACWCAKEAVFKWQGKRGISLKQNISISNFDYSERGQLDVLLQVADYYKYLTVEYEKLDGYFLAYVCNP